MRVTLSDPVEEDLTGQAGWMYTDLMLALMVIFLATISFVPLFSNNIASANSDNSDYAYTKLFDESMNALYESFNIEQIRSDISVFKSTHGMPADSDIVFAQFVGGYDRGAENPSVAIARAQAFSQKLDSENHDLVSSAATTLSSSNALKKNQVIVRLTFATPSKIGK